MYLEKKVSALDVKTYWDTDVLRKVEEELRAKAFLAKEGHASFSDTEVVMFHIMKQNGFLIREEEYDNA